MLLFDFRDMIATGCEDKCVRVFYVAASTDLPLKIFSGMDIFFAKINKVKKHLEMIYCNPWGDISY